VLKTNDNNKTQSIIHQITKLINTTKQHRQATTTVVDQGTREILWDWGTVR
jgi:hypothetical protein